MLFQDLKVGDKAIITHTDTAASQQHQRLMILGLTEGTQFQVTRVAPLGDPIEIRLRGFNLSLRRSEAEGVQVKKV